MCYLDNLSSVPGLLSARGAPSPKHPRSPRTLSFTFKATAGLIRAAAKAAFSRGIQRQRLFPSLRSNSPSCLQIKTWLENKAANPFLES